MTCGSSSASMTLGHKMSPRRPNPGSRRNSPRCVGGSRPEAHSVLRVARASGSLVKRPLLMAAALAASAIAARALFSLYASPRDFLLRVSGSPLCSSHWPAFSARADSSASCSRCGDLFIRHEPSHGEAWAVAAFAALPTRAPSHYFACIPPSATAPSSWASALLISSPRSSP